MISLKQNYLKLIILLVIAVFSVTPAFSQKSSPQERERWMKEMRQYKNDFLVRELDLTDEQKARFLEVYGNMEDETDRLNQQTRALVQSVEKKGDQATDLEREKAAEASFELKSREGAVEMKYYRQLKEILTPKQLLKLRKAERKFTRELMKHQPKHKK